MNRCLYVNGVIYTLNQEMPRANYILVRNGIIEDIGNDKEKAETYEAMGIEAVDLDGQIVLPGLIDSHLHMLTAAMTSFQLDLNGLNFKDIFELLTYIREKGVKVNGWIRAFGLSENMVGERRLPMRKEIDALFPDEPVIITRVCSHLSVINSCAISKLSDDAMREISGGEFLKDENGEYNGIATEKAQQYVLDNIPAPAEEDIVYMLERQQQALLSEGITAIHDAGTDLINTEAYTRIYEKFYKSGRQKLRVMLMTRPMEEWSDEENISYIRELAKKYSPESDRLFFGIGKLFADGSIGGKTAAVKQDYINDAGNRGVLLEKQLKRYIPVYHQAGFPVAVHAIGDRAAEYAVDLMVAAETENPKGLRHRIEHGEILDEALIEKIGKNKILVMTQPDFIGKFGDSYTRNLGEECANHILPFKSLLKKQVVLGFGTDFPVISEKPFETLGRAMDRLSAEGNIIGREDERLTLQEALICHTLNNAYGAGTEDMMGTLERGKFADFIVLDVNEEDFKAGNFEKARVQKTFIGGELV